MAELCAYRNMHDTTPEQLISTSSQSRSTLRVFPDMITLPEFFIPAGNRIQPRCEDMPATYTVLTHGEQSRTV